MKLSRHSSFICFLGCVLTLAALCTIGAPAAQAQAIQVESADPPSAEQGTINLNVLIRGSGFKKGAVSRFLVTGTTNPGGITVRATTFVSSAELIANIDVADDALLANFDIEVQNSNGRTGKGIELFSVKVKGSGSSSTSCVVPQPSLTTTVTCTDTAGGCLDLSFGSGGKALLINDSSFGSTRFFLEGGAAIQPDGKIIVAGLGGPAGSSNSMAAARLNPDGSLDASFGASGISFTGAAGTTEAVRVQSNGKILLAGGYDGAHQVVRLNPDGSLDASFGLGGVVTVDFGRKSSGPFRDLAIQADGKIIAAGGFGSLDVARLQANGALDTSFGSRGTLVLKIGNVAAAVRIQQVFVNGQPQDRILLAGSTGPSSNTDFLLARLDPSGAYDPAFGINGSGKVATDFCGTGEAITRGALEIDGTGRILTAGAITMGSGRNFIIARYTPDGKLDTTFGETLPGQAFPSGRSIVDFLPGYGSGQSVDGAAGIAVQTDGRLVLAGVIGSSDINFAAIGLVRFHPDGSIDTSFGINGFSSAGAGFDYDAVGPGPLLQADGKIVVAARSRVSFDLSVPSAVGVFRFWH